MSDEESIPIASEAVEAEAMQEETQVIEVEAPHGGIHTWKDFWVHLGTIALGLLIAIGLEQSVEWVHHLHQRHQLEADLRTEMEANHTSAVADEALYDKIEVWLLELQRGVDAERASGGKTPFVYPPRPDGVPDSPRFVMFHLLNAVVWTTAEQSELLELLPRDEAEMYSRVYSQMDMVISTRDRARELGIEQGAFEARYSHGTYPPEIDIAQLTPQELDEYEKLVAAQLEATRMAKVRLEIFDATDLFVLSGGSSVADLRAVLVKQIDAIQ